MKSKILRTALTAAKVIAFLLVSYYLAKHVATNWARVPTLGKPEPFWAGVACLLGTAAYFCVAHAFQKALESHGTQVGLLRAAGLYYIPQCGKYVPGKLWTLAWAAWIFRTQSIPMESGMVSLVVVQLTILLSGVLVGIGMGVESLLNPGIAVLATVLGLAFLHPRIFYRLSNKLLSRSGRRPLTAKLSFVKILHLTGLCSIFWILLGLSAYSLGLALNLLNNQLSTTYFVAAVAAAQLAGILALFAPAGLGVREGALIVALTPFLGKGAAIALTAVSRLLQVLLEGAVALAGAALIKFSAVPSGNRRPSGRHTQ